MIATQKFKCIFVMFDAHLVHNKNMQKKFSGLNLTKIYINLFTCNDTTFLVSFFKKIIFLNKLDGLLIQQAFISDILFQMHRSLINLWQVILCMLCVVKCGAYLALDQSLVYILKHFYYFH